MTDLSHEEMTKWNPELTEALKGATRTQFVTSATKILELRAIGDSAPKSMPWPDVAEEDRQVTMRDGAKIRIRIYSPKSTNVEGEKEERVAGRPVLTWFHGGGYCVGSIEAEEEHCRAFCREFGGVAASVDYRMAPEWKFPTAVHDSFDALQWISKNCTAICSAKTNVNPQEGFLIGGISAGGTLAIILTHLHRDAGSDPPITGLFTSISTCLSPQVPIPEHYRDFVHVVSWDQNADSPLIGTEGILMFQRAYEPVVTSPLASPLLFPTGHSSLPATYFQICGLDPNRDFALLYEKVLRSEGTDTKVNFYSGLPHGFWAMLPKADCTRSWKADVKSGLRWLLKQQDTTTAGSLPLAQVIY